MRLYFYGLKFINIYFILVLLGFVSFLVPSSWWRFLVYEVLIWSAVVAFFLQFVFFAPLLYSQLFRGSAASCPLCKEEGDLEQISGYRFGLDCENCGFISAGSTFSFKLAVEEQLDE